jgi:hypothetical protein
MKCCQTMPIITVGNCIESYIKIGNVISNLKKRRHQISTVMYHI